ncbi:hypothetical protein CRYUN_Cryun21dG0107500 [Craigia yunnanensis]
MTCKISPMFSILVLLLSVSLLPLTLTRNTNLGKKVNEEIQRNLIGVNPPDPCHAHAKSGIICDPPYVDIDGEKGATKTQGHN